MRISKRLAGLSAAIAVTVSGAPAMAHAQSLGMGSLGSAAVPGQDPSAPVERPSWKDKPIPFKAFALKQWRGEGWSTSCWVSISFGLTYWNSNASYWSVYPDLPAGDIYAVNEETGEAKFVITGVFPSPSSGGIVSTFGGLNNIFPTGETSQLRLEIRPRDGQATVLGSAPVTIPADCPISDEEALDYYGPNRVGQMDRDLTPEGLTLTRTDAV